MTYSQPVELGEALALLRQGSPRVIAGGTDVYPALEPGADCFEVLDTTRIRGFADITHQDGAFRFGAAATWSDVINAELPAAFDALKQAAREVGSQQIQNAGTVVGNLCNASPAADGVPVLLALDARVELSSEARGTRLLPLSKFIMGVRQTALKRDELVTAVVVPAAAEGMRSAFEKLGSRRYLVISITMTAANVLIGSDGLIGEVRIAVGSCSAVAQRLPELEADLIGAAPEQFEINADHLSRLSPIDDVRGTGAYRRDAVIEQIKRAVRRAGRQ